MVAYIHPGEVNGAFVDCLMTTVDSDMAGDRLIGRRLSMRSGPRIASARNEVVRKFLATECEWLWMLDTDMTFAPSVLPRLLQQADSSQRPILGALCFGGARGGVVFPTLYRLRPPSEDHGPMEVIEDYPTGLVKVDATGCACLLVHRSVFERIAEVKRPDGAVAFPQPLTWFSESAYGPHEFGEDWTFCLRVQQAGIPVYVDTRVKVGHVKPAVLDESAYEEYQAQAESVGRNVVAQNYANALQGKAAFRPPVKANA